MATNATVGDLIYFQDCYGNEEILAVEQITPGGTIVTSRYKLDSMLRVEGKRERWDSRPYSGRLISQQEAESIRQQWAVQREVADIACRLGKVSWTNIPLDKLQKIKAIIEQ